MKNYIGMNIKYLCDKNLLSQSDFGKIFNLTQAVINAYIKSKSNPQVETIQKICNHFELSIDDFINLDISKPTEYKANNDVKAFAKSSSNYGDKDKTIEAQQKTIATLEKMVEHLEQRLNNAS